MHTCKQLEAEYRPYREKLEQPLRKINIALAFSMRETLDADAADELRRLYRNAVKRLHPDLNPDITEEQKQLFYHAVEAYENGDINTLRMIDALAVDNLPNASDSIAELKRRRDSLLAQAEAVRNEIARIKSEFPCSEREFLADDEAVAARKAELENLLEQYRAAYKGYEQKISALSGAYHV